MDRSGKKSGNKAGDKAPDRRVQKTKKLLSDALVALVVEKGYDDVSIQEIIDRANVGRSTFYAHYENKEQLLLYGHEHLRNLALKEGADRIDFLSFYRHLAQMHVLAGRLLSGGASEEVIKRSLCDILHYSISCLHQSAVAMDSGQKSLLALRIEAAAAALVQLMTSWIRKGMPCSPETMAEESASLLSRILMPSSSPR